MTSIKSFYYSVSSSFQKEEEVIPVEIARSLDAILVLGGGVPSTVSSPPEYVKTRCDAAAKVALSALPQSKSGGNEESPITSIPAVLCLSAGTAHLPQLLSSDGLPVWESTASAAYILDKYPSIPASKVFAETTSYDTISNAFFSRTSFTDIVGWRKLLIITNEFHMDRTKEIFKWIFAAKNTAFTSGSDQYVLHFLSCTNGGLSTEALLARKEHENRGKKTVADILSKRYVTLQDVWSFLTTEHDFYTAVKLVKKGREISSTKSKNSNALKDSYGAVS